MDTVVFPEDDKGEEGRQEEEVKEANDSVTERLIHGRTVSAATFQREFELSDVLDYVRSGVASIIEDEVTQRFEAEELKSWNLLTRTNVKFHHLTWELSAFYWVGCAFRYCVLLPGRLLILLVGLNILEIFHPPPPASLCSLKFFQHNSSDKNAFLLLVFPVLDHS